MYWLRVGVQVSAKTREVGRAAAIVTASARKKVPVTPVIEIRGKNTTMGVKVEPSSGVVISRSAAPMACMRGSPASRCRTMFSTTTIASSITNPTAAARPPRVMRLKLCPSSRSTISVTSTVTGITRPATMDVPQSPRNTTIMIEARTSPRTMASRTLLIDSLTRTDWS